MKDDLLIRNGHVVDTASGVDGIRDVAIRGRKIGPAGEASEAAHVVDATGCYVLPGLIDYHTHVYWGGSTFGVHPDLLLAVGVTATVDTGTSGYANYEAFRRGVIGYSMLKIKSFLSVNPAGLFDPKYHMHYEPEHFNVPRLAQLKELYGDDILGLKIMMSRVNVGDYGLEQLDATIAAAQEIGDMRVCVHTTDPPCEPEAIARRLRPGDIYCHCYTGRERTILDANGKVRRGILEARERGVLFDAANGMSHYDHELAAAAVAQGFLPDIISTDVVASALNTSRRAKSLPYIMSKYLSLGLDWKTVVKAVTETPAKLMKMEGAIGTLKPGACADVTIVKILDETVSYEDWKVTYKKGDRLVVPLMTICNGVVAYCQGTFDNGQ